MQGRTVSTAVRRASMRAAVAVVIIAGWLAVCAIGGPVFGRIGQVQKSDQAAFLPASSDAAKALQWQAKFSQADAAPAIIVLESDGRLPASAAAPLVSKLKAAELLGGEPVVLPSPDGKAIEIIVQLKTGLETVEATQQLREHVATAAGDLPGQVRGYVTGPAGFAADLVDAFGGVDGLVLLVALAAVFFILLLVYRSILLPVIVLATSMAALCAAIFAVYWMARWQWITLDGQARGILSILVIGAATDYALLYVARFREELEAGSSRGQATRRALRGAVEPIVASAATVIAGLMCLLLSDLNSNRALGPVAASGIVFSVLAGLTLLPAVLGLLGRASFWPFMPGDVGSANGGGDADGGADGGGGGTAADGIKVVGGVKVVGGAAAVEAKLAVGGAEAGKRTDAGAQAGAVAGHDAVSAGARARAGNPADAGDAAHPGDPAHVGDRAHAGNPADAGGAAHPGDLAHVGDRAHAGAPAHPANLSHPNNPAHPANPSHQADAAKLRSHRLWWRIALKVERHPRPILVVTIAALGLACLGITQLRADGVPQSEVVLRSTESAAGQRAIARHFDAGSGSPAYAVVAENRADEALRAVTSVDGVSGAFVQAEGGGPVRPGAQARVVEGRVLLAITLADPPDSAAAQATVGKLRAGLAGVDAEALVGGQTATALDSQTTARADLLTIIPIIVLAILIILMVLLRAIVAPLVLMATTVLSYGAAMGVAALVFKHLFGFSGADPAVPLFGFVFLVALGVDYNIFLATRVREEALRRPARQAVTRGLAVTGGVITSAGVVLAATFAVLGVIPIMFMVQLGFIVAFGVLLDTLVVRTLLVPALAHELGRWMWWPSALSRDSRD